MRDVRGVVRDAACGVVVVVDARIECLECEGVGLARYHLPQRRTASRSFVGVTVDRVDQLVATAAGGV